MGRCMVRGAYRFSRAGDSAEYWKYRPYLCRDQEQSAFDSPFGL